MEEVLPAIEHLGHRQLHGNLTLDKLKSTWKEKRDSGGTINTSEGCWDVSKSLCYLQDDGALCVRADVVLSRGLVQKDKRKQYSGTANVQMEMWLILEKFRTRHWISAWQAAFGEVPGAQDAGGVSLLCPLCSRQGRAAAGGAEGSVLSHRGSALTLKKKKNTSLLWFWALSNRQLFPSALQCGVGENLASQRCRESGGIMLKSVWFIWCETIFWQLFVPKPLWSCQPRWAVSIGFSRQLGSNIHKFSWAKHWLNQAPSADFLAFFFFFLSNPLCFLYYHKKNPSIYRNL